MRHDLAENPDHAGSRLRRLRYRLAGYLLKGEDPIQRSEERFEALLEAAPDGVVIVDSRGQITLVNAQTERMFGYDRTQLVGRDVSKLIPEHVRETHGKHLKQYMGSARTRPMGIAQELYGRRADGSEFPVEISLSPLHTEEGLLVSAAVRDVSERKRLELEADRVKDEFFSLVSHEMRTPLASIVGYAELLAESDGDTLSDRGRRALEVIRRNAEREKRLVNDLLLLVRVEAGAFSADTGPMFLEEVVELCVDSARPAATDQGVEISVEAGDLGEIEGDPSRLTQVVENLISNAIKFSPDGGRVTIRTERTGDTVVLSVADQGLGIPEGDLEHLFERLYRASSATEMHIPGAGLGLTIVKAIVDAHAGTVRVESREGEGTTFTVRLPQPQRV